ncbi:MAG TPA: hypothetical protein VJU84_19030 [Pyrinomonadaceae bacterium]|nr:hypothetical protein [Pyrinomonadaceae bacterium]
MIRTVITKHLKYPAARTQAQFYTKQKSLISVALILVVVLSTSCKTLIESRDVRPLVLRDVPAQRLAFRFTPDAEIPAELLNDSADTPVEAIQLDFSSRRQEEALIKTVRSPDGQRALALYGTADTPGPVFRIDLYSTDGNFLRNITPPDLACVFPETVAWSPQGNYITFVARKTPVASPSPTPEGAVPPETLAASPLPSIAPAFPSVPLFATEQIYICDRDGYGIKPLTSREGLIYFYFSWAPDNHALVAIACRESEWDAREREYKMPAGRPRLITLDGNERLLDDRLTEALPVWSPDSSKVATAFETDAMIYDAATNQPTQGRIKLSDPLLAASRIFDARQSGKQDNANTGEQNQNSGSTEVIPASFNPIIRLKWATPEKLYLQTAFVRLIPGEPITTFQRWHLVTLSPQAAILR